jgi:hypothetical protein
MLPIFFAFAIPESLRRARGIPESVLSERRTITIGSEAPPIQPRLQAVCDSSWESANQEMLLFLDSGHGSGLSGQSKENQKGSLSCAITQFRDFKRPLAES